MVPGEEFGHWTVIDVLRVGLVTDVPAGRPLPLGDFFTVFLPPSIMRLKLEATVPGRRYGVEVAGPCVSVLPPCRWLAVKERVLGPLVVLALDPDYVRSGLQGAGLRLHAAPVATDPYLNQVGETLRQALESQVPPGREYLATLAEDLREHLCRRYTKRSRRQEPRPLSPDRLARARALMQSSCGDNALSVERIASHVGLSPFHFTRLFTAATGKAPHAHLTQVRIDEAKRLLGDTCLPIAEIAQRTGYSTHAHFTGMFGRHVGMTPAAWRTQVRAERAQARKQAGT
jgi:transcriptional regulator GlxA family with amidase domain